MSKVGLDDFLIAHSVEELRALATDELRIPPRPGIEINNRQLHEKRNDALKALAEANHPPTVYNRAGILARLKWPDEGPPFLDTLEPDALRNRLTDIIDWYSTSDKRGQVSVSPPLEVVRSLLALAEYKDFPPINGIVTAPIFAPNGALLVEPGYHQEGRVFLHAPELENLSAIDTSAYAVQQAKELLAELICDFRFVDEASRSHALCFMLEPFVRLMIAGSTPIYIFDAPKSSTGKTLLCQTCAGIFNGGPLPELSAPHEEEEWQKRLPALLETGRSHIFFDNVKRLQSESLFALLTTIQYQFRPLGTSTTRTVENRCTWSATSNNLLATDELLTRSVWSRQDAGVENPAERTNFRHKLPEWAEQNRRDLVIACLTLIKAWIDAGKPAYQGANAFTRYQSWVNTMGGIMEFHGYTGFLDNQARQRERSDTEGAAWKQFVNLWYDAQAENEVAVRELFGYAQECFADRIGDGTDRSQKTRFGKLLLGHVDRIYDGKKIVAAGTATSGEAKGAALYRLEVVPPDAEDHAATDQGNLGNLGNLLRQPIESIEKPYINTASGEREKVPHLPQVPRAICFAVTPTQQSTARIIAAERTKGHNHCRRSDENRGSDDRNREADYYGVLAELVLAEELQRAGLPASTPQLLASRPPEDADFEIGCIRYDVKAVLPGSRYACINAEKHDNANARPDFYALVLFTDDKAFQVARVPAASVEDWELREAHSLYRSTSRESLAEFIVASLEVFRPAPQEGGKAHVATRTWR